MIARWLAHWFPTGVAHSLGGGVMIGAGVGLLFLFTGLVGGMSSVYSSTWSYVSRAPFFQQRRWLASRAWRLWYAVGLVLGAALWLALAGPSPATGVAAWQLLLGGVIAGFGARMSNGCTSGHGICGLASLQLPSLLAVLIFLATAIATANLVGRLGGT